MLHISSMFRDPGLAIPPLLCFKGGSLGFLTIHDFADHRELIDRVLAAVSSPLPPLVESMPSSNPHHRSNSSVASTGSGRSASWRRHGSMSVRIIGTETVVAPLSASHPQPNSNPFKALPSPTEVPTGNNSEVHTDSNDITPFDNSISRTNLALPIAPAHNSSNSPLSTGGSAIVKSTVSAHESATTCTFIKAPPIFVIPRMRLFCRVYRGDAPNVPISIQQPLNELLVDRGSSAFLSSLELWIDGQLVTNVQADGLIVATPSGSSAYSLSAGGPLVAPSVCALLVTPICPHSLSFRPLLLPDCSRIKIRMPDGARASAWASFDGRAGVELRPGDFVEVIMSRNPLPTISFCEFNSEWFDSIVQKLHWNVRTMQKPLKRSPSPKL
jgi:NAD kinase